MSEDQKMIDEGPSRRTFLKVSAVAGATVAVIAAGASVIPKIASSAAKSSVAAAVAKPEARSTLASSSKPLIVVVNGDTLDVYQGESKFPIQDSSLAREIASRVSAKME
jgi:hypothetical protein